MAVWVWGWRRLTRGSFARRRVGFTRGKQSFTLWGSSCIRIPPAAAMCTKAAQTCTGVRVCVCDCAFHKGEYRSRYRASIVRSCCFCFPRSRKDQCAMLHAHAHVQHTLTCRHSQCERSHKEQSQGYDIVLQSTYYAALLWGPCDTPPPTQILLLPALVPYGRVSSVDYRCCTLPCLQTLSHSDKSPSCAIYAVNLRVVLAWKCIWILECE